ncbi:MAG: caspase family protein, partial [Ignavibacteriae bacterium]|nr:caspase family protein [Ignavibacteriota bacterium]
NYVPENSEGIKYARGKFGNLKGALNDIEAVKSMLVTTFQFKTENIIVDTNSLATREKILNDIKTLIDKSKKGDVVFLFYSGHGSQRYNSLSKEIYKKDETIVPYDAYLGTHDIRDKELAVLENQFLEKGILLTCIFDCCHSGGIARGELSPDLPTIRQVDMDTVDVADAFEPPAPYENGALIMSACLSSQTAGEKTQGNNKSHGNFTFCFINAINSSSPNETASRIFLKTKALMNSNNASQEPVILGVGRENKTLFGTEIGSFPNNTFISVLRKHSEKEYYLQGGTALGLNPNCELAKYSNNKIDENIVLKVTENINLSSCYAEIIKGSSSEIKESDLFVVVKWVKKDESALKIWMPNSNYSTEEIKAFCSDLSKYAKSKGSSWVNEPDKDKWDYYMYFDGKNWGLRNEYGDYHNLGTNPSSSGISNKVKTNEKIFVNIPPPKELIENLKSAYEKEYNIVEFTDDPISADYILAGRMNNNEIEYSWVLRRNDEIDTLTGALPPRSDWYSLKSLSVKNIKDSLLRTSVLLAKVKTWLTLNTPPGSPFFPYHLGLKKYGSDDIITGGILKDGDKIDLLLTTDETSISEWKKYPVTRYVYIITIDRTGFTQVLFPKGGQMKIPIENKDKGYDNVIFVPKYTDLEVGFPFGVDTYILLTTDEPISDPTKLNGDRILTREGTKGPGSELENLFYSFGSKERGTREISIPVNWSIERIYIKSQPK